MTTRFLLTHKKYGIYLGAFLGLGIWSKLDPAGQDAAVTFPSRLHAFQHTADWSVEAAFVEGLNVVEVVPDLVGEYASMHACVLAGGEPWLTKTSEVGVLNNERR